MNSLKAEAKGDPGIEPRPAHWAQPIDFNGLPNFHKVTNDLYRGAQPTAEGIRQLKKLGIKTILNLRTFHSDKDEIGETKVDYEHIRSTIWHPKEKEIIRFLQIVTNKHHTPVFVHCMHGADRTGVMCAVYRLAICGWTKEEAIDEMTKGGFGFHKIWGSLITCIEELDISDIMQKAGIE